MQTLPEITIHITLLTMTNEEEREGCLPGHH